MAGWRWSIRHWPLRPGNPGFALFGVASSIINNTMLIPIAVLAWLFLGERLPLSAVIGLLIASIGVLMIQMTSP